jgi:hypothetical protein
MPALSFVYKSFASMLRELKKMFWKRLKKTL